MDTVGVVVAFGEKYVIDFGNRSIHGHYNRLRSSRETIVLEIDQMPNCSFIQIGKTFVSNVRTYERL